MGYVRFLSVTIVTDMIFRRQAKLVELNNPGPKCWRAEKWNGSRGDGVKGALSQEWDDWPGQRTLDDSAI